MENSKFTMVVAGDSFICCDRIVNVSQFSRNVAHNSLKNFYGTWRRNSFAFGWQVAVLQNVLYARCVLQISVGLL
jgi:hypothetical protein